MTNSKTLSLNSEKSWVMSFWHPRWSVGRWHAHFDGLVEFVSLTEQTYWQAIYGREVIEEIAMYQAVA